jgi:trimethylamine--corrinoid protein Co-methyltransferase
MRPGSRTRRTGGARLPQLPWTRVVNPYAPMEILSADQIEAIHLTSLRILEEIGIELMSPRRRVRCGSTGRWWSARSPPRPSASR